MKSIQGLYDSACSELRRSKSVTFASSEDLCDAGVVVEVDEEGNRVYRREQSMNTDVSLVERARREGKRGSLERKSGVIPSNSKFFCFLQLKDVSA
jgi:hypothetical protein